MLILVYYCTTKIIHFYSISKFFIAKEGNRDNENYYRDKYRAYKTKSNSEWLKLPDELIVELLADFKSANNIKINKQSKKE